VSRPKIQTARSTSKSVRRTVARDGTKPSSAESQHTLTITSESPTGTIKSASPIVRATVEDSRTRLSRNDINVSLAGEEVERFNYSPATGSLRCCATALSSGSHRIEIEATAAGGLRTARKS
jgi:hypothetical protein